MLKLKPKKLEIILFTTITIVAMLSVTVSNKNSLEKQEEIEQTTATPVSGKVVILDAGHGRRRSEEQLAKME